MPPNLSVSIFDMKLLQEWLDTCGEYGKVLGKPFSKVQAADLLKCEHEDPQGAFQEYGIIQFYLHCAVFILMVFMVLISKGYTVDFPFVVVTLLFYCIEAFIHAHFGWFAIVKRPGCCCAIVACCEGPPIYLLWGAWLVLVGCVNTFHGIAQCFVCPLCFVAGLLQVFAGAVVICMGVCCISLWRRNGSQLIPESVEVHGADDNTVTAAVQVNVE